MNAIHAIRHSLRASLALGLAATFSLPALAHHSWSWTEDGLFELRGTITELYIGNPHATLDVDVEGEIWRVELAPPSRTVAAGFAEDTASPGDEVIAIGNRSLDPNERRMKAVRIIINETAYDVYPGRVPTD